MHENRFSKYLLLWCVGVYLRLGVLIVPPLLPRLESLLGFSAEQVAIATSLPVLFIALGALASGWMARRFGIAFIVTAGLLVMAADGWAHALTGRLSASFTPAAVLAIASLVLTLRLRIGGIRR